MTISFENLPSAIPPDNLREWLGRVAREYNKRIGNLSYIFVDDDRILEVNRNFLEHDYYTDVITFDYSTDKRIIGEVYISLDTVYSNATLLNQAPLEELMRVIAHALLHLLGFFDKTPEEQEVMRENENFSLLLRPKKLKEACST